MGFAIRRIYILRKKLITSTIISFSLMIFVKNNIITLEYIGTVRTSFRIRTQVILRQLAAFFHYWG